MSEGNDRGDQKHGRRLAEWVSMGISLALVLGVAGYLCYEMWQPHQAFVPPDVRPLPEEVRETASGYILPVAVHNGGGESIRHLKARVTHRGPDGAVASQEFTIDYLGEWGSQRVYLYFDRDPRTLDVRSVLLHYATE